MQKRREQSMNKNIWRMRRGVTALLILTLGTFDVSLALRVQAASTNAATLPVISGELFVSGIVTLDDLPAISGATIFDGANLKTSPDASATIHLRHLGRVYLAPDSEIRIGFNASSVRGFLRKGSVTLSAPQGIMLSISTVDGLANTDGRGAASLMVNAGCGTQVRAEGESSVSFVADGRRTLIAAGATHSFGVPDAGSVAELKNTVAPCSPVTVPLPQSRRAGGFSSGALLLLILAGIGGAVAGIVLANRNDNSSGLQISNFRP
jgi:hypothetical protein